MSIPNEETRQAHIHATAATTCPPEITATMLQHMHAPKQTKNTTDVAARHIFFAFFLGCQSYTPDPRRASATSPDPALGRSHLAQNALGVSVPALVSERHGQIAHALKRTLVLISELLTVRRDDRVPDARRSRVPPATPQRSGKEHLRASVFWLHLTPCTREGKRRVAGELLLARLALEPRFVASVRTLRYGLSDEARGMRESSLPATRASHPNRLGTRIETDDACHFFL